MSLLDRFRQAVARGALKADQGQEAAAEKLQTLSNTLAVYRAQRFALSRTAPRGLYLWGDVGRGKSMLMDMFFENVAVSAKRRVHFNAFMRDAHALLHEERRHKHSRDPLVPVAKRLAEGATLLCFDEFQVEDVADAMILGRLFEQLFARGSVVVATSNIEPDKLYWGGLNRQLFLPFIAEIKERMEIVGLNGNLDYRLGFRPDGGAYFTPLGCEADAAMDQAWQVLTNGAIGREMRLPVLGRHLTIRCAAKGVARFTFDELCGRPLAGADYLAAANAFHTVLIDRIPALDAAQHDEARRFVLLIDTLYDAGIRLICSAATPAQDLYLVQGGVRVFGRTISRLLEMQSEAYISKAKR
jgi:cell division protein ZapE